ncbi:hypothetical protein BJ878DRAFT_58380 [Calycina marina]|uniref:Uncharacterized protein n=1 Tax=Calycina marina TaxID=1763456 RepID=A0A9P7Z2Y8_9HELO|nr:hypothetical protein BJ878DRAFT_58380 [Calycina marina]
MDKGSHLEINELMLFWDNICVNEHTSTWRLLKTAAFDEQSKDDDDMIAESDVVERANAPARKLSGGQVRKLQLAFAFVGGSKV